MNTSIKKLIVMLVVVFSLIAVQGTTAIRQLSTKEYAHKLANERGWTGYQWVALNNIIIPESNWNPCRHYPSTTNCKYSGSNACGVPQANPCPMKWRGDLWNSRYLQVEWLMNYIHDRYHTPAEAYTFRVNNLWY